METKNKEKEQIEEQYKNALFAYSVCINPVLEKALTQFTNNDSAYDESIDISFYCKDERRNLENIKQKLDMI